MTDVTDAARALLAFWAEAGVTASLRDDPVDRLGSDPSEVATPRVDGWSTTVPFEERADREPAAKAPLRRVASSEPTRVIAASAAIGVGRDADAAVMAAREAARSAATLEALRAIVEAFEGCPLKAGATSTCFSAGRPGARVMFVGEAPGRDEDLEGVPFVGRSGKLLDRMMAAIGLDRESAYIANIIPWRPPGNRTPTPLESQICLPFVTRQIELADPDLLVCLGAPSAQALIGIREGIMKSRGRWFTYATGRRDIRALATLHPAYLLRQPLAKRLAWRDFLAIRTALDGTGG